MENQNKSNGELGMQVYEQPQAVSINDHGSAEDLKGQVEVIQQAMKSVMSNDEHYGTIPGTNKPTLLKPGAEKLSLLFRFAPEYEVTRYEMDNAHREYEVKCRLTHINSGNFMGAGVGSCSTMEKKYRYRKDDKATGVSVPKSYWDNRKQQKLINALEKNDIEIPSGASIGTTKENGRWEVSFRQKIENPDIADVYNTVLKMAKKRAHVDAILTATAASDIFTQDVEDMPEFEKEDQSTGASQDFENNYSEDNEWLNKTEKDSDELTKMWKNAAKGIRADKYTAQQIIDNYNMKDELAEELVSIQQKVNQK